MIYKIKAYTIQEVVPQSIGRSIHVSMTHEEGLVLKIYQLAFYIVGCPITKAIPVHHKDREPSPHSKLQIIEYLAMTRVTSRLYASHLHPCQVQCLHDFQLDTS